MGLPDSQAMKVMSEFNIHLEDHIIIHRDDQRAALIEVLNSEQFEHIFGIPKEQVGRAIMSIFSSNL